MIVITLNNKSELPDSLCVKHSYVQCQTFKIVLGKKNQTTIYLFMFIPGRLITD